MNASPSTVDELSRVMGDDESDFLAKYPCPALILASSDEGSTSVAVDTPTAGVDLGKLARPTSVSGAGWSFTDRALAQTHEVDSPTPRQALPSSQPSVDFGGSSRVIFLAKSARNPFDHMLTLGRAANNDIVLELLSVSKVHAYFTKGRAGWSVTDQRSTNGTFVDGQRLEPGTFVALADGAVVGIGPAVRAKFFAPSGLFRLLARHRTGAGAKT
jgi:hypothetical protein